MFSLFGTLPTAFSALRSLRCVLCTALSARSNLVAKRCSLYAAPFALRFHCAFCTALFAMRSLRCGLCVARFALRYLRCALSAAFFALCFLRFTLCAALSALRFLRCAISAALSAQFREAIQRARRNECSESSVENAA